MPTIQSAELLSVGTELLLGEIVDTNSAYLAADLSKRGVDVYWSQRVGDNLARVQHAVRQGLSRSDLLVMCGGLGPTDDDLSREAVAEVLGETPYLDAGLERDLRERFARFARTMPEKNLKQAWLIPSAETLPNPRGTAPGWLARTQVGGKEKTIVLLPGPPRELVRMWEVEAVSRLELPTSVLYTRMFKTFGLGESAVAETLAELTASANPSVATYAKRDGVHVRVAAKGATFEEAEETARPVVDRVASLLGRAVWGVDEDELELRILERLNALNLTLATAETCTGGRLSERLSAASPNTPLPNAVATEKAGYRGGVVAYSMQAVSAFDLFNTDQIRGAVTEQTVLRLAKGVATKLHTHLGLATATTVKENHQEEPDTFVAIYSSERETVRKLNLPTTERDWFSERASYAALFLLWSFLTER